MMSDSFRNLWRWIRETGCAEGVRPVTAEGEQGTGNEEHHRGGSQPGIRRGRTHRQTGPERS